MELVFIGQPNCGKSTIFNLVAGYKSVASNFPGVTVKFIKGEVEYKDRKITVIDLPGTYSLQDSDEAELEAVNYILNSGSDTVIVNIIDAGVMSRSLELSIQLMELGRPMVLVLNMMDEAERKGIKINSTHLSELTGLPVVETIARKGEGISEIFEAAINVFDNNITPAVVTYPVKTEETISSLISYFDENNVALKWAPRFTAVKLLENDRPVKKYFRSVAKEKDLEFLNSISEELQAAEKKNVPDVLSSFRHNMSFNLFEKTAKVGHPAKHDIRKKIDGFLMHPVLGYLFLAVILYFFFRIIFSFGSAIEPLFLSGFSYISNQLAGSFPEKSLMHSVLSGLISGFGGGIIIVIPYLLPFFLLLAFLEDTGYLARIAYLIDNLMHKIGLHGMSIVPMILGYGCTVPGILATRILKSKRDKLITATLTTLVPCSARMTIIFGLVGFFISIKAAVLIYLMNLIVIAITGKFLSKVFPEVSPGLVLEIPKYHLPSFRAVSNKTWFRLKEFVVVALPLLVLGSILLEIVNHFEWSPVINNFLSPFTVGVLGLPAVVGITLLFGLMRKELALILLFSALGTQEVMKVMSAAQIFTFTVFVTFYIPCLGTLAALGRELKWKNALLISLLTIVIAIILSVIIRFVYPLLANLL